MSKMDKTSHRVARHREKVIAENESSKWK